MPRIQLFATILCLLTVAGCNQHSSQNAYSAKDIGVSHAMEFGTVIKVREIDIIGENSERGAMVGGGIGAGAGSYVGNGSGNSWAIAGSALAGAVAGHFAEQAMNDRKGYEYTLSMQSGDVKTIAQEKEEGGEAIKAGDYVMLQYCDRSEDHGRRCVESGRYQRLTKVDKLPAYVKKRKQNIKYVSLSAEE